MSEPILRMPARTVNKRCTESGKAAASPTPDCCCHFTISGNSKQPVIYGRFANTSPFGLGFDPDIVYAIVGETRELVLRQHVRAFVTQVTRQGQRTDLVESSMLTREKRAQRNGVGRLKQRELDYLAAQAPDLLSTVEAQTLSAHRAYQLAKGRPPETPLTTLHRVWRKVAPEDRLRFLSEMLTPAERRTTCISCLGNVPPGTGTPSEPRRHMAPRRPSGENDART